MVVDMWYRSVEKRYANIYTSCTIFSILASAQKVNPFSKLNTKILFKKLGRFFLFVKHCMAYYWYGSHSIPNNLIHVIQNGRKWCNKIRDILYIIFDSTRSTLFISLIKKEALNRLCSWLIIDIIYKTIVLFNVTNVTFHHLVLSSSSSTVCMH